MKYKNIKKATFISRPNRFTARVLCDGIELTAHVKNTGRCRELLIPGAEIYLEFSDNSERKTPCDLIAVQKGMRLINMDSQAPNKVYFEYLSNQGYDFIKPECIYKSSRFDFYSEINGRKTFTEVKGVTLENNGVVMFPDAPTLRGIKHINDLCDCVRNGFEAEIVFIVQMDNVKYFTPNKITHPEFAYTLKTAWESGVKVRAMDCVITPDSITVGKNVEVTF